MLHLALQDSGDVLGGGPCTPIISGIAPGSALDLERILKRGSNVRVRHAFFRLALLHPPFAWLGTTLAVHRIDGGEEYCVESTLRRCTGVVY